ncbi:unnamed protein product [Medioppia subpectinata]|uniref:Uncharacterized protein n=1 Tax=Medioppia subpectinata TaxID=1979941 RepID=A0A7R9PUY1_9ACAR|nr:unnamed protein product [Medioppia subpectinata]CAG2101279.1 unnamed protein product [Medioppia subpectinata]
MDVLSRRSPQLIHRYSHRLIDRHHSRTSADITGRHCVIDAWDPLPIPQEVCGSTSPAYETLVYTPLKSVVNIITANMSSRDTEVVQQFNAELSSLYEVRPPISKAKMSQITKSSMKAIKMYKHIVQSVERFIIKCRPEYKIPGLYVIDSIVRQSRHQFGVDKDVYAARFARNFGQTFQSLFLTCPTDDKPKIVRVLNLWQRNNVFTAETIQPLLDMANPNAALSAMKFDGSPQPHMNSGGGAGGRDGNRGGESRDTPALKDPTLILQLQQLANSLGLTKPGNNSGDSGQESQNQIKFNKKLLDFDYGDDEEDEERGETPTESEPPMRGSGGDDNNSTNPLAISMAQNLLSNPELLQQLQAMQKTIQQTELLKLSISELEAHGLAGLGQQSAAGGSSGQQFMSGYQSQQQLSQTSLMSDQRSDRYRGERSDQRSRSRSPRSSRRGGDRDREGGGGGGRRSHRSRSRSPRGSRFSDRPRSPQSFERERERERRRKGLPTQRKGYMSICSTTLWLGHVPKLVSEADLSDTFGEFGAINSIDLIPSRGCAYVCMNRRQDAAKALTNLRNVKLHGSVIKMAWAPGKGMKGKEYKDYWEADEGASYIPYTKLSDDVDLDLLEEGGTVDEDTVPEKLQEIRKRKNKEREDQEREAAAMMARAAAMMQQPLSMVALPATSYGVTGLVIPPNMMNITSHTPVMSMQSATDTPLMTTAITATAYPQLQAPPPIPSLLSDDPLKNEITEVVMNTDNNDRKSDSASSLMSNPPLFPPPLPPFQTPLGMPPMPPILGAQSHRLPWLSGPPPPILPNRMQGLESGTAVKNTSTKTNCN